MAVIDIMHVAYKAGAPAMIDVIGGQDQLMFQNLVDALPMIKSGKVRARGIAAARRSSLVPDISTAAESGLPGYESTLWCGVVAPAGTPAAIVNRLNDAVRKMQQQPVRGRCSAA